MKQSVIHSLIKVLIKLTSFFPCMLFNLHVFKQFALQYNLIVIVLSIFYDNNGNLYF